MIKTYYLWKEKEDLRRKTTTIYVDHSIIISRKTRTKNARSCYQWHFIEPFGWKWPLNTLLGFHVKGINRFLSYAPCFRVFCCLSYREGDSPNTTSPNNDKQRGKLKRKWVIWHKLQQPDNVDLQNNIYKSKIHFFQIIQRTQWTFQRTQNVSINSTFLSKEN